MGKFDRFFDDAPINRGREPATENRGAAGLPPGRWISGGVYLMEALYKMGSPYGAKVMGNPDEMEIMRRFGASGRTVFLDLETTGLSGGAGTYAFLCGLGRAEGDFFKISQFFLMSPAYEARWLDAINSAISPGACLVTYNGRTFDIPLLRTRHVMTRKTPHWDGGPHIDLLHLSRRLYRGYLDSCSLGSIERNVLKLTRSGEDIPGSEIPALYARYLRSSDASELGGVFYHNELDIASLAALYCHVARVLGGDTGDGRELLRAGDVWHRMGQGALASQLWNMACGLPRPHVDAVFRRAMLAKRNGGFTSARDDFLYILGSIRGGKGRSSEGVSEFTVLEELAKLEEHRFRSPDRALVYAEDAIAWLKRGGFAHGRDGASDIKSMERRRTRLIEKIGKAEKVNKTRAPRVTGELNYDEN